MWKLSRLLCMYAFVYRQDEGCAKQIPTKSMNIYCINLREREGESEIILLHMPTAPFTGQHHAVHGNCQGCRELSIVTLHMWVSSFHQISFKVYIRTKLLWFCVVSKLRSHGHCRAGFGFCRCGFVAVRWLQGGSHLVRCTHGRWWVTGKWFCWWWNQ